MLAYTKRSIAEYKWEEAERMLRANGKRELIVGSFNSVINDIHLVYRIYIDSNNNIVRECSEVQVNS